MKRCANEKVLSHDQTATQRPLFLTPGSVDKSRFVRLVPAQLSTIYGKVLHSWMEATPRDALASLSSLSFAEKHLFSTEP